MELPADTQPKRANSVRHCGVQVEKHSCCGENLTGDLMECLF